MSDETPPQDETPEDKARRERDAELFGDIEDVSQDDAIAELQRHVTQLTAALQNAQRDNLALHTKVQDGQSTIARLEAKAKEDQKYAVGGFVKEMLSVIDTLELGLSSISQADRDNDPKYAKLVEGFEKALGGQLGRVFNKFGIAEINPINAQFDENKHEVLTVQPKPDTEPETVIVVAQKGYELNGRLLRAAKVIITPP